MRVQVHLYNTYLHAGPAWRGIGLCRIIYIYSGERTLGPTFDLISFWLRGRANEARNSLAKIEAACRNVCMAFSRQHVSILGQIFFSLCVDSKLLNTHTKASAPQWNKLHLKKQRRGPKSRFGTRWKKSPPIFYVLKYPCTFRSFAAAHNEQEIVSNAFFRDEPKEWRRRWRHHSAQPRRTKMIVR